MSWCRVCGQGSEVGKPHFYPHRSRYYCPNRPFKSLWLAITFAVGAWNRARLGIYKPEQKREWFG